MLWKLNNKGSDLFKMTSTGYANIYLIKMKIPLLLIHPKK